MTFLRQLIEPPTQEELDIRAAWWINYCWEKDKTIVELARGAHDLGFRIKFDLIDQKTGQGQPTRWPRKRKA